MNGPGGTTRVVLACSGLDHAKRGFESFARECFDALRGSPELDIELVKGSGRPGDRERSVPTLRRDSAPARALGRLSGREPFRFEQFEFAFSMQPLLLRRRPDVVYFSEWHTGLGLAYLRRLTRQRHRLVICNGGMAERGFDHLDRVQQLTPVALDTALANGAAPERQVMLPLGALIDPKLQPPDDAERRALRERLGLPVDGDVLLSVAALNRSHKRLDYLIEEVARLPEPRPFVLMAGQEDAETAGIRALAADRLGAAGHSIRTVPHDQVADLYRAADAHLLTSLGESFGRVLIEAMAHGLPCLAHDYAITRFVLGDHGMYADLSQPGALADLIRAGAWRERSGGRERKDFAYERFGWDRLRPRYAELLANRTVSSSTAEKVARK
jgi:glycosyltransferase involved in cell wall biosynthesis